MQTQLHPAARDDSSVVGPLCAAILVLVLGAVGVTVTCRGGDSNDGAAAGAPPSAAASVVSTRVVTKCDAPT
jgi:hypothetical protein